MLIELRDTRLQPLILGDTVITDGEIVLMVTGEPGERHPNMAILIGEDTLPLRKVWEQGKAVEFLSHLRNYDYNTIWEVMLTMTTPLGRFARAQEAKA